MFSGAVANEGELLVVFFGGKACKNILEIIQKDEILLGYYTVKNTGKTPLTF